MIRKLRWKFVAVCMGLVALVPRRCSAPLYHAVRQNIEDPSRQMLYQVLREDSAGALCPTPPLRSAGTGCCCLISQ